VDRWRVRLRSTPGGATGDELTDGSRLELAGDEGVILEYVD